MRIGIDATPLTLTRSGVGRYAAQLLSGLQTFVPSHEYRLLAHRPLLGQDLVGEISGANISRGIPSFPVKSIWMQLLLPRGLRREGVDLCHFTNYLAPVFTSCPMVVTFHDMSLFLMSRYHVSKHIFTVRPLLPLIARRAGAVIAVSESARRDILRTMALPSERVHVVYEAAAPQFRPIDNRETLTEVAQRYRLQPGFLLFVGTIEPRKNLIRMVEALHQLHKGGLRLDLVVVGQPGWKYDEFFGRIESLQLQEYVRLLGFVCDDDLPALYNLAGAFVFPSLYEGFGLPVMEAMACGTPVITSNVFATSEIAGDAALQVDPLRTSDIAEAVHAVLSDRGLAQRLSGAGRVRAAQFSWERAARETAAIYEGVVQLRPAANLQLASAHPSRLLGESES